MQNRRLRIPKSFYLHGQKIKVEYEKDWAHQTDENGNAAYRINRIILQPRTESYNMTVEATEQIFCHELVHFILFSMESDRRNDEKFVNLFGSLLHQALVTMEYDK